ncbi:PREDICTED: ankyrin repeat domain-containing protein 24-like [Nicotiana attenuata]|uniref:ankyrin repeat domain-containing protein 24-like n=1 Tax=Nicotiana attenuata TaxID=49451 RepID=UPI000904CBE8|nr:PREDICTED: ankyrin repeat domain-containing protein 24-like [Nicotiana attenuata]
MAKTSKTVPKKDKASSSFPSWLAKSVVLLTLEEITPGDCVIKKDFGIENPPDVEGRCEHLEKENKRKRVSKPEDPQDKKTSTRRLRKGFAQTGTDSAHDSLDGEENDNEESALVTRTRNPVEVAEPSELENRPPGEDARREETGKAPMSPEVEIVPPSSAAISEGVNVDSPHANDNAPSEELGAATIGSYKVLSELRQCEVEIKRVLGEEKALRLLCSRTEEELKDLRTALAKAQKSESELDEQVTLILTKFGTLGPSSEANTLISQMQQKLNMIGQLRCKVDRVRADCHQWKENMDRLVAEKEAVKAQLASAEAQLRGIEAKGLAQAREIKELEAELAKARTKAAHAKAEAAQTKAEAEKTNVAADKLISIYCQARRETLEEIHDRGFNLAEEIAEAQARETDARFLISSDEEDMVSGCGDEESEEAAPEGEYNPKDKATRDEDGTLGDMAPKLE